MAELSEQDATPAVEIPGPDPALLQPAGCFVTLHGTGRTASAGASVGSMRASHSCRRSVPPRQ